MNNKKFLERQYKTLRKEIEFSRDRMYKTIIAGASFVPAAQYLSQIYELTVLTLLLPLLVMILVLLYISNLHALLRCGTFIRLHIEKTFPDVMGWEEWLESSVLIDDRRNVDKLINYSFYLLSALYYIVSVRLATQLAYDLFGETGVAITLGIYVSLGIFLLIMILKWTIVTTKSTDEILIKTIKDR